MICTLGDLLLDVIVLAPRELAAGADTPVETRVASGGQAANVAAWVVELGETARFVGKHAEDEPGELARSLLERRGVALAGPHVQGKTGVVVSFVGPDGERSMATDRGVSPELRAEELDAAWFAGCRWLHLSGYSLLAEPIAEAALAAGRTARGEGARVSVDLSSWSAIRAYGPERFRGGGIREPRRGSGVHIRLPRVPGPTGNRLRAIPSRRRGNRIENSPQPPTARPRD